MTKLILALALVALPVAVTARAADDIKVEEAKTEGKKTVNTVKKDHKKIAKSAKSEAGKAWAKTKDLFKSKKN